MVRLPCGVGPTSWIGAVVSRRRMSGRDVISEDFVDRVDGPRRTAVAPRDRDEAIEKRVCWVTGLEARGRPEVVTCGVDWLATSESRHHLGRSVPQAERRHRNERAVVCQQRDAKV